MSKATEYRDFIASLRSGLGYWKSYSLTQFTLAITRMMHSDKISGRKLASLLGMSPAQVSKVLSGNENVTIETMVKFADALDAVVYIHVAKRGAQVQWSELPSQRDASTHLAPETTVTDFFTSNAYAKHAKNKRMVEQCVSVSASFEEEAYG